jgi:hypothetical protein
MDLERLQKLEMRVRFEALLPDSPSTQVDLHSA